jgi:hypothetical protein
VGLTAVALADTTSDAVIAGAVWDAAVATYGAADTYGAQAERIPSIESKVDGIETHAHAIDTATAAILADTGTDGVVVVAASKTGYALISDYNPAKSAATQSSVDEIHEVVKDDIPFIIEWITKELVRTDNGDGTITYVLGATTPMTWVHTTATGTRAAATT